MTSASSNVSLSGGIKGAFLKINEEVKGLDQASLEGSLVRVAQIENGNRSPAIDEQKRDLGARLSTFLVGDGYESFDYSVPPEVFRELGIANEEFHELEQTLRTLSDRFNSNVALEAIEIDPRFETVTAVIGVTAREPAPAA